MTMPPGSPDPLAEMEREAREAQPPITSNPPLIDVLYPRSEEEKEVTTGEHPQTPDEQAPSATATDKVPIPARKGLRMEFPNGASVTGYALDDGGFLWLFQSNDAVMTRVRLSGNATFAIGVIAERLLDPTSKEAA